MTSVNIKKAQYHLMGLPPNWVGKELDRSKPRSLKLIKAMENLPENPMVLVVSGDIAPLVNHVISELSSGVAGIDYIDYFAEKLGKSDKHVKTSNLPKFVVLYNVGYEAVNNYSYSSKLVKQLLHTLKDKGVHVLLQTNMGKSEFERCYEINIVNHVSISQPQEEKII